MDRMSLGPSNNPETAPADHMVKGTPYELDDARSDVSGSSSGFTSQSSQSEALDK